MRNDVICRNHSGHWLMRHRRYSVSGLRSAVCGDLVFIVLDYQDGGGCSTRTQITPSRAPAAEAQLLGAEATASGRPLRVAGNAGATAPNLSHTS